MYIRMPAAGLAFAGGLFSSTAASGAYVGLSVTSMPTTIALNPTDPAGRRPAVTIYRVWANFTEPDDALYVWGGGGSLGQGSINNSNATFTGPGGGFLNNVFGGVVPPNSSAGVSYSDSYFTIGVTLQNQIPAGAGINLSTIPGTPNDVTGTSINLNNGTGIFTPSTIMGGAPNPITLAGFTGDGDTALRVLLMQLVVRRGELVHGTIGITITNGSLAGGSTTIQNQMFGILIVPAPGALTLVGCSCLVAHGRRRRQ
jgi:hypothetical protein